MFNELATGQENITTVALRHKINEFRAEEGKSLVRNDKFLSRVKDELDLDERLDMENFSTSRNEDEQYSRDREVGGYTLTMEQAILVGMRESKTIRKKVLDYLRQLQGKVVITEKQTVAGYPALDVPKRAADNIESIRKTLEESDPRLCQMLVDMTINAAQGEKPVLLDNPARLVGVTEIADELGHKPAAYNRSMLGKYIRARLGGHAVQEDRLVNGRTTAVYCYPHNLKGLHEAVHEFVLASQD